MSTRQAASERGIADSTVQEAEHDIIVSSPSDIWAVAEPAGNPDLGAADSNCFLRSAGVRFLLMVCFCGGYRPNHRAVIGTKPDHLKILDLEVSYNAVVLKVMMIVAVFSGLSFVATTSSDDRHARDFLEPMVLRLRKILLIRDISFHFQVWAPKRHWRAMNCGPHRRKKIVQSPLTLPIRRR